MRFFFLVSIVSLVLGACGGDSGADDSKSGGDGDGAPNGDGDAPGDGDSDGDGDGEHSGEAPVPGVSQEGWQSAFADVGVECGADESAFSGAASVTIGATTLYVGYEQVSGNNQDPVVARFDDGELVYCRYHEDDGPDGRAVGLTWNGGDEAYVVYTVVGGGTDLEGKGGWLSAYAPGAISGGGAKVSYLGRVDVTTGELRSGTFIISVLMSGSVNTHNPSAAPTVLEDGTVQFLGESAHKPIDSSGTASMDCTDYPFDTKYVFSSDLTELVCAESSNCVAQTPCD